MQVLSVHGIMDTVLQHVSCHMKEKVLYCFLRVPQGEMVSVFGTFQARREKSKAPQEAAESRIR